MSNQRKKIEKKKARQKTVKKKIIEKRLAARKEAKMVRLRDEAYEREFAKKQNLNLSAEEIKQRLEHNMKILEALEEEYLKENPASKEVVDSVKEQLDLQKEMIRKTEEDLKKETESKNSV